MPIYGLAESYAAGAVALISSRALCQLIQNHVERSADQALLLNEDVADLIVIQLLALLLKEYRVADEVVSEKGVCLGERAGAEMMKDVPPIDAALPGYDRMPGLSSGVVSDDQRRNIPMAGISC